ncbi:Cobalt uptake protein cot1 [Pyricularia oryzae]|uniref:non-specific serine/threonine protein kinase n=3 Tax=Pyricularia TaxID=48558 RepID=A0ABQ8NPF9_PYRGI|nr:AGC/NDR protein kinase [Pyricularia oryzae 70-15]KAH8841675.1 Cobalt uptake protein cot1 [Pyricularia oryzae]KAI6300179.1 Cobalt uptake protein cot1 [Pyricularia grisea]EHA57611.1 AGC/NDR protein kinase [Pyricularia oryzae 70-15]KAH9434837.1 Cobalt uptake protein cot1 [Pyricularia oryzae]KAI6255702.1 Cobalt uptake protein cot1 [Pyricularia oryzae]
MDNQGNRLYLNFDNSHPRPGGSLNDRGAYPTTPSTFPQPVFPGSNQQPPSSSGQGGASSQQSQPYSTGYAPQGYFSQNQYPAQYPAQPPHSQQSHGSEYGGQQQSNIYQPRSNTPGTNDPNVGLAHQFSQQNLRAPYGSRGPSPAQRPRTAGAPGQQPYGGYHSQPMPPAPAQYPALEFQPGPERNPDKYGPGANNNQKKCAQLAADFFKDSVKRARERNQRQSEMELKLSEPNQSQSRKEQIWSTGGRKEGSYLRFLRTKDKPENYNTIKIIGKGAFGEVKLVQKKSDNKVYAMKSLIKTEMFKKDQLAHVRAERDILAESDSPWVVKLFTTFQDANFLYMLMEFLPGGDLMTMLIKYEIFSEDITRFYIAEIVLAIEAVHKLGFIHRDIKPDNILLDRGGHVKLTDFGLSTGFHKLHDNNYYQQLLQGKSNRPRGDRNSIAIDQINLTVSNRAQINDWRRSRRLMAYSTVGTPDYIAPEIFTGHGYTFDCDWWSLGTIMFECLVGWPPFCAEDSHDTYRKIVNWRQSLYFPDDIQLGVEAENLIRSLICNTENRLGRGGAHEIKSHSFFRGVEFEGLRRIRAPFEPRLTSAIDTTYFPTDEIDQTDNATVLRAQQMQQQATTGAPVREETVEMSLPFIGYTFKRFDNNFR